MSEAVSRIQRDQKSILLERLIDANPTVFADLRNVLRIVKDASFYTANDAFDGIVVNRKLCNKAEFTEWDLAKYKHLKGVCVLDYSLENTQSLSLSPCAELEKLIICSHCFENGTGSFVVDACHCLKSVEIGSFFLPEVLFLLSSRLLSPDRGHWRQLLLVLLGGCARGFLFALSLHF